MLRFLKWYTIKKCMLPFFNLKKMYNSNSWNHPSFIILGSMIQNIIKIQKRNKIVNWYSSSSKINKRSIWHGLLRLQSQTSLADSIILRWEALGITSFCRDILNSRLPRIRERCLVGALMRYVSEAFWISEWKPCLDIYAIQLPCLQPKGDTEHCPVSEIYIAQTCYPEEIKNLLILPLQWA